MSELKEWTASEIEEYDDARLELAEDGKIDCTRVYIKSEVDAAIAELNAENKRLKKCEIWMKQHFYCEEVIACESAKNRRLKRALWLARAERAKEMCQRLLIQGFDPKWEEVERKCRAKAEEYK